MIETLQISGYRLLRDFTADLEPLTVIIGPNSVGKSTLLDCLQLICQCAENPISNVVAWHWGMGSILSADAQNNEISWALTFRKPKRTVWSTLPIDPDELLYYEVVLRSDMQAQPYLQYEVLCRAKAAHGFVEPFKFLEAREQRRYIYSREKRGLIPFDQAVPAPDQGQKNSQTGIDSPDLLLPAKAQESTLMLSNIRFFNDYPIPSSARLLLSSMAFYPGFDVTRHSNLRMKPAEIRPTTVLAPNGENLGTVLHEILTRYDYRSAANEVRDFVRAGYPTFEEIHCDTTFGAPAQVVVRVREKGMRRSMELWELSDGMVRFLCLAVALLNPSPPPFVAVDEPEAGLHPKLLPIVADMIRTAAERTQVLATTHSPELLDSLALEDIAVMVRKEDAVVWHRPATRQTLRTMLTDVAGGTLGDLHRSGELEATA